MINGFCDRIEQDVANICQFISQPEKRSSEQDQKVVKAAIRIFAVLGMVLAVGSGVGALAAVGLGTLFKLASAGLIFSVCHDMFVMTANSEKNVLQQVAAVGKGFFADVYDLANGSKTLQDAPRHPLTEGTLLRPFWDVIASS